MKDSKKPSNNSLVLRYTASGPGTSDDPAFQVFAMRACLVVASLVCIGFGLAFYFVVHNKAVACVHAALLAAVVVNHLLWLRFRNYRWSINVALGIALLLVLILIATGGWDDTALYWPFAFVLFSSFLAYPGDGRQWGGITLVLTSLALIEGGYKHFSGATIVNYYGAIGFMLVPLWLFQKQQRLSTQRVMESNRQLNQAQLISRVGSWSWDIKADTITWSPVIYQIFGVKPGEPQNFSTYMEHIYKEDRPKVTAVIEEAFKFGRAFSFDHRVKRSDGTVAWIHGDGTVELDTNTGQVVKIYGSAQDITNNRVAESELAKRNQQLEDTKKAVLNILDDLNDEKNRVQEEKIRDDALINSIGDGLVVTDEYGRISLLNPVAERVLGIKTAEAAGKWYHEVIKLTNNAGKPLTAKQRPLFKAISTGKDVYSRDLHITAKNNEQLPVAMTASPFIIDGKPRGVIELFSDITNEKVLDQAKDDFLALVSHQLQTPATAVKQFLGLILEGYMGKIAKEQQDIVQKAYDNNEEQINIIQDLLEVARIESGKSVLGIETIKTKPFIEEIVNTQQLTIDKRQQRISVSVPAKLEFRADPVKIKMCVSNLLSNAIKYTPEQGQIEIRVQQSSSGVSIGIKDDGIGMTKDQISRLFKRFGRVGKVASVIPGTGIGLFLCKQIAEMHGGTIEVTSEPGKGSEFTLQLPKLATKAKAQAA